jgi:uncharacterized protein (DUF885 family)
MDSRLLALENDLVATVFAHCPGQALAAGAHEHDLELDDVSPEGLAARVAALHDLRRRAAALDGLSAQDEVERRVALAQIEGALCELEVLRTPERDPYWHCEVLSSQLNMLAIYDFASLPERARAVVAKQCLVPRFVDGMRRTLRPTAPILAEYGVRGAEGALSLVREDLPGVFAGKVPAALQRELDESARVAAAALEALADWLRQGHATRAAGSPALGAGAYAAWLRDAEGITTPLHELEAWALDELERTRADLAAAAARIDAAATPAAVVERVVSQHPPTGRVVAEATRIAEDVHAWISGRRLVTFPTTERVLIADTPAFMRWSFGSMWTPGPFERAPVRATFYATDADPAWSPERQAEHLTAFSTRGLENLAIHEAYPGHFIQALHQRRVASPVRRTFWWGVFGEGWAHYCELMALEEGFGGGAADVRLVQLQEALVRLCRFVNGIRVHARTGWSFDDGTRFFTDRAWLTEAVARAECERAAIDPFYLRYTLGKQRILELREECRRRLGARFDLRAFHDALLGCGSGPMPCLRTLTIDALGVTAE